MKTLEYNKFMNKLMSTDFNTCSLSYGFALKLEYLFLCSDLSLFEFALAINLNYSYLNDLLRSKKHISLNKIECICNALHVDVIELFDFTPLITMQEEKCFIKFPIFESLF